MIPVTAFSRSIYPLLSHPKLFLLPNSLHPLLQLLTSFIFHLALDSHEHPLSPIRCQFFEFGVPTPIFSLSHSKSSQDFAHRGCPVHILWMNSVEFSGWLIGLTFLSVKLWFSLCSYVISAWLISTCINLL